MRRPVILLLPALLFIVCARLDLPSRPQEMGELALVRVLGVDADGNETELTATTGRRGQDQPLTVTARADSFGAALHAARSRGESTLHYGHADQLLLGEQAVDAMLPRILDGLCRQRDTAPGMQVWMVRGGTARGVLTQSGAPDTADRLETLALDSRAGRTVPARTAMDLAAALAAGESVALPALRPDGDGVLQPAGCAVLRRGRLVCIAEGDAALGLELLEERGRGRVDAVTLPDGTSVALTLEKVRVRASPVFTGGELTGLAVRLDLPARLAQGERPLSPEELDWIEREVGILEGQRAVRALELAQSMDADFCGMEARARNAQNARRLAEQWPEAFRGLDIRVSAVCRAERTMETMGR